MLSKINCFAKETAYFLFMCNSVHALLPTAFKTTLRNSRQAEIRFVIKGKEIMNCRAILFLMLLTKLAALYRIWRWLALIQLIVSLWCLSNYMNSCLRVTYTHLCPTGVFEGIYSRDFCSMYAFMSDLEIAVRVCLNERDAFVHNERSLDIDEK